MNPYLVLIIGQLFFSISDLMARHYVSQYGFKTANFLSIWFIVYILLKVLAISGQLWIFSRFELGKAMALFGVASIIFSNLLGFLILNEVLTVTEYLGVLLAILSFLVIALASTH